MKNEKKNIQIHVDAGFEATIREKAASFGLPVGTYMLLLFHIADGNEDYEQIVESLARRFKLMKD